MAKKLRARLADLREAETITDIPAGQPREIEGGRFGYYAVKLADGFRLVLSANHNEMPLLANGKIDWSKVSRVKIRKIEKSEARHG